MQSFEKFLIRLFFYHRIIFLFHKNNNSYTKAKVKPPRLDGQKLGLFATRTPYRPNPIGMSLVKLDSISGNNISFYIYQSVLVAYICDAGLCGAFINIYWSTAFYYCMVINTRTFKLGCIIHLTVESSWSGSTLHLSSVDLLDGTPVLDIKPYIPDYDQPHNASPENHLEQHVGVMEGGQPGKYADCADSSHLKEKCDLNDSHLNVSEHTGDIPQDQPTPETSVAEWISEPLITELTVVFTSRAEKDIEKLSQSLHDPHSTSVYFKSCEEIREAITSILKADPRSPYRRKQCTDKLYYFTVDTVHITCWFDDIIAEVLAVKPTDL